MNFLAHLYLSQNNTNLIIGNFIADGIKGKDLQQFSSAIQEGIVLHRAIDTFTDAHPVFRKSKRRLNARYRHYDSVIIDIFYDYFLAKNWHNYSAIPLDIYTQGIYSVLGKNESIFPENSKRFYDYMVEYNILYNYQYLEGIERVLKGMNNRTQGKSQMDLAIEDLRILTKEFEEDFTVFFKDIKEFVNRKLKELTEAT
jgi:acyl carrier protein phosphodiesterase